MSTEPAGVREIITYKLRFDGIDRDIECTPWCSLCLREGFTVVERKHGRHVDYVVLRCNYCGDCFSRPDKPFAVRFEVNGGKIVCPNCGDSQLIKEILPAPVRRCLGCGIVNIHPGVTEPLEIEKRPAKTLKLTTMKSPPCPNCRSKNTVMLKLFTRKKLRADNVIRRSSGPDEMDIRCRDCGTINTVEGGVK